ncbi:MAG: (Fe-S)-binding protein, partial [Crenarchaeota archaeon]|nr:(Fe-S)-binding protein [Thermoproteota archaeon]
VAVIPEQGCCGDPARRIGDELMFLELARQNVELLSRYRFRRLLVTCPHGYNVFRNEYPKLGLRVEVEHHSQLLARLTAEGRLKPARRLPVAATFHDPCYLGRWNGEYEAPRQVLRAAVAELREMPRSRERSFCCGGGGGGAFYDPKIGRRLSRLRAEEAKSTGAKVLAVACPFCNVMLSAEAPDLGLEVKDIAELLDEAVEGSGGE